MNPNFEISVSYEEIFVGKTEVANIYSAVSCCGIGEISEFQTKLYDNYDDYDEELEDLEYLVQTIKSNIHRYRENLSLVEGFKIELQQAEKALKKYKEGKKDVIPLENLALSKLCHMLANFHEVVKQEKYKSYVLYLVESWDSGPALFDALVLGGWKEFIGPHKNPNYGTDGNIISGWVYNTEKTQV